MTGIEAALVVLVGATWWLAVSAVWWLSVELVRRRRRGAVTAGDLDVPVVVPEGASRERPPPGDEPVVLMEDAWRDRAERRPSCHCPAPASCPHAATS